MTEEHRQRLAAMLAQPDPPEMGKRTHRFTQARHPLRHPDVIKRDLGVAYVAHRRQDHTDGDISCVVRVNYRGKRKHLRVVNGGA